MSQPRSSAFDALIFVLLVLGCVAGLSAIWKVRFADHRVLVPEIKPIAEVATKTVSTVATTTTQAAIAHTAPPGMVCDEENVICVNQHYLNSLLENPFSVTGTFAGTANALEWSVESKQNAHIDQGSLPAASSFSIRGGLQDHRIPTYEGEKIVHATSGVLAIYWRDGQGLRRNELRIPVRFPSKMTKASFVLVGYDPSDATCHMGSYGPQSMQDIYASTRPVETAIRAMLWTRGGVAGIQNSLPEGTQLKSLEVSGGKADILLKVPEDFDVNANCFQKAAAAQLENTLKQFPSIKNVSVKVVNANADESR